MKATEMIARAMALVAGKTPSTRGEVEKALRDCETGAAEAKAQLERLAVERPALLVGGSDADLEKHGALVAKTTLERDRAEAIAAKLRDQLAAIAAAEANAEKARRRAEVELQCELAVDELRKRYPKAIAELHAILRTVATAQVAVERFAKDYPKEPHIADPERVARTPAAVADDIVSEREVWRWEYLNGTPLPDFEYLRVTEIGRNRRPGEPSIIELIEAGQYAGDTSAVFESQGLKVRLVRKVRREVLRQERRGPDHPLAAALELPGLMTGDAGWKPIHWNGGPAGVLAQLEKLTAPVERKPKVVVEYLPVEGATGQAA